MESSVAFVVLILLSAAVAVVVYGFNPLTRWRYRKLPGPPPQWLFGNLREVIKKGNHAAYTDWHRSYGPVFKLFLGQQPVVVVHDPEAARAILLRSPVRHEIRGPASLLTGKEAQFNQAGLFSTHNRDLHRSLKSAAWLPVVTSGSLDAVTGLMNEGVERLCDTLARVNKEGRDINIWRQFGHMTMDVVGTSAFGVDLHTQEGGGRRNSAEAEALINAAQTIFGLGGVTSCPYVPPVFLAPFTRPLMRVLAHCFPDRSLREVMAARQVLRGTVEDLIRKTREQEARASAANGKSDGAASHAKGAGAHGGSVSNGAAASAGKEAAAETAAARKRARAIKPGSFLSLLVNARHVDSGEPLSELEAAAQAFTFLLAGYETTASALAFTVYCIAANPDKCEKLLQEVDAVARGGPVGHAELERMPYLEACLKEGLRLYPPGPFAVREATEDMEVRGHVIPRGAWVHVPMYSIQRDPEVWPEPEAFEPERWIPAGAEKRAPADAAPHGAWMPFGDGTRSCIGMRFAKQEAHITLARLFQRFTFELSPGQVPLAIKSPFTLAPRDGVFVRPVLREHLRTEE
ncbi:hypothetical protein WJX81_001818 [Elliptochloris bilobata]|uniref:Cytochrome P450 n=1 Tax=Elliptochloris bilobata TaxID=381761 RepID=A0AAW1R2T2_9CHLO